MATKNTHLNGKNTGLLALFSAITLCCSCAGKNEELSDSIASMTER